jgi:Mg-chelatase subunit ChlD
MPPPTNRSSFHNDVTRERPLDEIIGRRDVDHELRADVASIAEALAAQSRRGGGRHRSRSHPRPARFDAGDGELDLDATVMLLAERRPITSDELPFRRPQRKRRSVALLADVSGSMDGPKARITAATVGALVSELSDEELTVIAFWKDAALLRARQARIEPTGVVSDLLSIEARGLTNIHGAIQLAARELQRSSLEDRCIVLLSDCVHNAGPDPRLAASTAPTTHVLVEYSGEYDSWMGEQIAAAGGGRCSGAMQATDVANSLNRLLGE